MEKYIDILKDLIQIQSVNDNEKEVAEYIQDLFKDYDNVETELFESYPGRDNIIVKVKGKEEGKIFALSGHLDVVEAGEGWTHDPFSGHIEDGKMYGRGTSDMKAGLAASIYALLEILEEGADFPGEIWLLGTVGEEVGMQGALDLVESNHLDGVDAILISEPTKRDGENQAIFASKGSIMYEVKAKGKAAHSSMPEIGINAIMTIVDYIRKVQDEFDKVTSNPDYQNENLGSTLNVFSIIEGGIQFNSVPDFASIKGNIRTVPEFGSEESIKILQDAIDENNKDDSKAKLSLDLIQVLDPAEADKDTDLIKALKDSAPGKNVQVRPLTGTCELSRYTHISDDIQLVVYGPGLTQNAHIIDEYIELDEYKDAIETFKNTALKFLNK
ncbi:ArgE/DapE family deacylase [uncultured Helcococcus sp.]|uniref:ArgE/DapE family deacylase n=1 Tax=uncultured Helcococcus sp. TaxID=1072508 RepID=UPI00288A8367|nr:ArgE/DapE family deacylase [uncultured Helcococcus sp.]